MSELLRWVPTTLANHRYFFFKSHIQIGTTTTYMHINQPPVGADKSGKSLKMDLANSIPNFPPTRPACSLHVSRAPLSRKLQSEVASGKMHCIPSAWVSATLLCRWSLRCCVLYLPMARRDIACLLGIFQQQGLVHDKFPENMLIKQAQVFSGSYYMEKQSTRISSCVFF